MIAAISMDLFPTICTAVGAGFVFFVGNKDTPEARRSMLGLAGGGDAGRQRVQPAAAGH